MGQIELVVAEGEPVAAQVLGEDADVAIGEPVDVVTRATISLPQGEYRLRVDGKGRLGRTYRIGVNRGETQSHLISIRQKGRLLGGERSGREMRLRELNAPIRFAAVTHALELLPGKADLIEWGEDSPLLGGLPSRSLNRRDGATGQVIWDASHPRMPFTRDRDPGKWISDSLPDVADRSLLRSALDLNGDGTRDLLWFNRWRAVFLALSGKDGSMIWSHDVRSDRPSGPRRDTIAMSRPGDVITERVEIAGPPAVSDIDGDGTPDLVATILFPAREPEVQQYLAETGSDPRAGVSSLCRRVVRAISGRTGRPIWSEAGPRALEVAPGEVWRRLAVLVPGLRSKRLAVVDGTQWRALDPVNGRAKGAAIELGFEPMRPVQYADLDGDGEPEILALDGASIGRIRTLHAFSLESGRELWAANADAACRQSGDDAAETNERNWNSPVNRESRLVVDLDADGRSEIIIPDSGAMPPLKGYRGVRLVEGLAGTTRWRRALRPESTAIDGVAHMAVAPDLDGDGARDVIVVSRHDGRDPFARPRREEPPRVYVDALSGRDGRQLWLWHGDVPAGLSARILAPKWWGRGADGWPLLAVPLGGEDPDEEVGPFRADPDRAPVVHVLEASTGRERHRVLGLARAAVADLDGDGLDDLWGEVDGALRAFRGEAPEAWRALGRFDPAGSFDARVDLTWHGGVDFNGDGVADTLLGGLGTPGDELHATIGSHVAMARSGRDGRLIWKSEIDVRNNWRDPDGDATYELNAFPLPAGDLDRDGVADVIVKKGPRAPNSVRGPGARLPVELLSGRTGARLWSTDLLPVGLGLMGYSQFDWIEPRVVEPNGTPDLIVRGTIPSGARLARISGRDGRVLWDVSLSAFMTPEWSYGEPPHYFGDLDGDGGLDVVLILSRGSGVGRELALVAISLRDGGQLWSRSVRDQSGLDLAGEHRVGDLDGDSRAEVVVLERSGDNGKNELAVSALDGRDGKVRWMWKQGVEPEMGLNSQSIALADLDGNGTKCVCVRHAVSYRFGGRRIVVLDKDGKERARRDLARGADDALAVADLNGDGREEVLVLNGDVAEGGICALDGELKDVWAWPARFRSVNRPRVVSREEIAGRIRRRAGESTCSFPAVAGRAGAVVVTPPGWRSTLRPRSRPDETGQAGASCITFNARSRCAIQFALKLLDPGDAGGAPLLIGNGLGATVCRVGVAADAVGAILAAKGRLAVALIAGAGGDPRWVRPLPWWSSLHGMFGPMAFLVAGGLALVNVVLPLLVLRLVIGRRRVFRMWVLMVMPVAVVVPLMVYLSVAAWLPVGEQRWLATEQRVFVVGTLAGVPVVLGVVVGGFGGGVEGDGGLGLGDGWG